MDFQSTFKSWLEQSLQNGLPAEVEALTFNLYEPAQVEDVKFGIELYSVPL
jgi:hypothetical protein